MVWRSLRQVTTSMQRRYLGHPFRGARARQNGTRSGDPIAMRTGGGLRVLRPEGNEINQQIAVEVANDGRGAVPKLPGPPMPPNDGTPTDLPLPDLEKALRVQLTGGDPRR